MGNKNDFFRALARREMKAHEARRPDAWRYWHTTGELAFGHYIWKAECRRVIPPVAAALFGLAVGLLIGRF